MKITYTADTLTMQDSAGCFWLFGLFFISIGAVFVAGPLGLFSNADDVSILARWISLLLGLAGISAGLYVINGALQTQATFDRGRGRVTLRRRGIFRRTTEEYRLAEISAVYLEEGTDSDGDPVYRAAMRLRSGRKVHLSLLWIQSRGEHERAIQAIQEILSRWRYLR